MEQEHLYLALAWVGYGVVHSVLALSGVKSAMEKVMGAPNRYRLLYSLVATVALLAIFLWGATLPAAWFLPEHAAIRVSGMILATYGLLVLRMAMRQYSFRAFVGLAPVVDDALGELKTDGVHRHVRHPLYSGLILILLGFLLFSPTYTNLTTVGVLLIYLAIGVPLEERKLLARFGDAYQTYRRDVPALIPRLRKRE